MKSQSKELKHMSKLEIVKNYKTVAEVKAKMNEDRK